MSRIDVSVNLAQFSGSNSGSTVQLYKYEPFFGNVFTLGSGAGANDTLDFSCDSALNAFLVHDTSRQAFFYSTNGPTVSGSNLSFTISDVSGTEPKQIMSSLSYTVNIGAGRFLPPTPTTLTFYKNEPVSADASSLFIGSIPISTPASTISLPAGIGFVSNDICSYYMRGTPLIQSPASNYNILATGTPPNQSKLISINTSIRVNGERLILDISGTGISSNATVNQDISQIVVSGRCPPYTGLGGIYSGSNIRYSWYPPLIDGLRFTNSAGDVLSSGTAPNSDLSSTIVLKGSVTNDAIRALTSSNFDISLFGTRVSQPTISNVTGLRVTFKETVVFDDPDIKILYKDASVNSSVSSNSFYAQTKFALSGGAISNITSANLPAGLTLDFSYNAQRAFLRGKPTDVSSTTSTIRAINSNSIYADLSVNFSVVSDFITLTPSNVDACSTFIVSRSLSDARIGYYKSPMTFNAYSASGCNVTMSITDISGTGITFTGNTGSNVTFDLSGTPITTKALTNSIVTALVSDTSVSADTSFQYSIVPERYTFADASINAIQNVPISPVTISATTLSGLPVVWYSSPNLPPGLVMDTTGVITGTVLGTTSGTFNVNVSTGTTVDTCTFPYYTSPDSIILFAPQSSYIYNAGANVSIPITGLSYSGATVSNYRFSGLPETGLTIGSNSGLITGPLSDSIPPNPVLPAGTTPFDVCGSVGVRSSDLHATFTTINPIAPRSFLAMNRPLSSSVYDMAMFTNDTGRFVSNWVTSNTFFFNNSSSNGQLVLPQLKISDFKIKNTSIDSNVFLGTLAEDTGHFIRSTDGVIFSEVLLAQSGVVVSSIANVPGTSTWFAAGTDSSFGSTSTQLQLKTSTDDGLTWSWVNRIRGGGITLRPRDIGNTLDMTSAEYPYLLSGTSLSYKNGVLMAGGRNQVVGSLGSFLRSTDDGSNWSLPSGAMLDIETSKINTDGSGLWIATGSQLYDTVTVPAFTIDANTILYSTDNGSSWTRGETPVSSATGVSDGSYGQFNYFAYDTAYGNGCWLASGISLYSDGNYYSEVRVSSNGSNWTRVPFFDMSNATPTYGLIGPILYANNSWNVVNLDVSGSTTYTRMATHADTSYGDVSGLLDGWSNDYMFNGSFVTDFKLPSYRGFTAPQYVRTGTPTQAIIQFQNTTGGGPTFTSPTQTSYTFYQYMPIPTITFAAIGTGTVYLFINTATLPTGLTWNPYTQTIQGKTVNVGTYTFTVYAKDTVGITALTISVTTVIPRVVRQQTSAGAYTYLVKQYTEVNAAQAARDARVTPTQDVPLGKFMAPPAPSVTTQSNCPC